MYNLEKIDECTYLLPKEKDMLVPGLIIASEEILKSLDKALDQVKNVACLPGIVGYSIAMPDIHWGYGFPIGGVAAMDINEGVISPGGVGYDINCGVRIAIIDEEFKNFDQNTREKLIDQIYELVPSGVGHGHRDKEGLSDEDFKRLTSQGASWAIENGYGLEEDIMHIESNGRIDGADIDVVSEHAKERGKKQLGTVGSGNHFIEIGQVEKIYDEEVAKKWNISLGKTYVQVHTGSRGFGHQICQDTLNEFLKKGFQKGLPDRQLVAAPIQSEEGKRYFKAMAAAANFAFNNRQRILHYVREAFLKVCNIKHDQIKLLYDVCHNVAKFEEHMVNGKTTKLCVHRKGATRAFKKGSIELPKLYQETGQPVLIPGDMKRASYIMVGLGNPLTWQSSCHGAGRSKSRMQSLKEWKGKDLRKIMAEDNIYVKASSYKTIAEEMPDSYKDIDKVVQSVHNAKLAKMVAKLKPSLVIKG